MQQVRGRPRVRAGRPVNISDWEKQSQIVEKWNDELCCQDVLPEVEIISLLEEQIPQYKLRADTLTKFGGYENQDWFIPSPALQVDEADLKLSPDQIRETLNYFLLCSDRVSQMTKTYDDIEAVTRLLEEKEKDLELTARIGKELLQTNNKLENTIVCLENDHRAALEKITQLTHEVHKKTELIQILTNDMDESCFETASNSSGGRINLELMNKKITSLEDENKQLKVEFNRLAQDTDDVEAQERRLLNDLTGQLTCANSSMCYLEDEIDRLKDETRTQHEQILSLQSQLRSNEDKLTKYIAENEELISLLQITKDNQGSLAIELSEFKARYYEVQNLLQDAQEQLRKLRKKQQLGARISMFSSLGAHGTTPFDNLHSELEMSMHSDFSADSGLAESIPQYKKVFETVRCASRNSLSSQDSGNGSSVHPVLGGTISSSSVSAGGGGPRMSFKTQTSNEIRRSSGSIYNNSSLGYPSLESSLTSHSDTEFSQASDSDEGYPGGASKGIPGIPGATDIEAALKRLTPAEVLARRSNLQFGPAFGGYDGDAIMPFGSRTPDSLMSTGSGHYRGWKLPEKLQIVKPMEGSQTLHHWSQLAQPSFAGLLDERPGVKVRGGKDLDELGLESYGLYDLEEDVEYENPGKLFDCSAPTFTLTNSMVMHPDDGTFVTPSNRTSRVASVCSSIQNSPPQTPRLSRRNSCSTFSTTFGLAKMLNERGIKAVTPSAISTPCGPNSFTPTATPCNSPDSSPGHSRSSSPERPDTFSLPQLILSSVPQFLRDSMGAGGTKKKTSFHASRRLRNTESLIGKIERIGITNIMGNPGSLAISTGMYARPALTSPMAQLTCLLPSQSIENISHIGNKVPPSLQSTPTPAARGHLGNNGMGVPGRPGSGALSKRLEQLNSRKQRRANGITRPDLGTVYTNKSPEVEEQVTNSGTSTLGTLSSLLFGRKGGLF